MSWIQAVSERLKGEIVTVNVLGCQTDITETIVNQGVEDVLAVKENQGNSTKI